MAFLASVVRTTRARFTSDKDGSVLEARFTDEHQALQHAERNERIYRKAVLGLAGLLLLSLCGNLASAALIILIFKESRSTDAIQQRPVALSDSKAAAPVGTWLPVLFAAANIEASHWPGGASPVRCLNRSQDMVSALRLTPLTGAQLSASHRATTIYSDAQQTLVLKQYTRYSKNQPRERETCVLQALQQFSWAPRWFCTGTDYMLSSFSGRPTCRERVPPDYILQISAILADLRSVGVRHNDLYKDSRTDFLVDERTGGMSLTDFGWSSINGSLGMTCTAQTGLVLVAATSRPRSRELNRGVAAVEAPESVTIPRCSGIYSAKRTPADPVAGGFIKPNTSVQESPSSAPKQSHKFMQSKRAGAGSQREVPVLQHVESTLHIGGYQHFHVARNGSITYTTQTSKYDRIQGVLAHLLEQTGSRTLADVGCNNGLVSFLAQRCTLSTTISLQ